MTVMEVKKPYVFISYSRKDYVDENKIVIPDNTITKIVEALDNAKINYWIDLEGIYSGDAFAPVIGKAIKNCDLLLFVSSKKSNASQWVSGEIASARNYGKKIVPIKIDNSPYDESVVVYIANLDAIEYNLNPKGGLSRLVKDIKAHFTEIEEEARKAKEEEDRRKEAERLKAEEEKRRKEQEEKNRKEAQKRIVTEIRVKCRELNNEETKIETDRDTLLASTAMISDEEEREKVKSYIASSSPLRKKVEEEMAALRSKVEMMEKHVEGLAREKVAVENELKKTKGELKKRQEENSDLLKEKEELKGELENLATKKREIESRLISEAQVVDSRHRVVGENTIDSSKNVDSSDEVNIDDLIVKIKNKEKSNWVQRNEELVEERDALAFQSMDNGVKAINSYKTLMIIIVALIIVTGIFATWVMLDYFDFFVHTIATIMVLGSVGLLVLNFKNKKTLESKVEDILVENHEAILFRLRDNLKREHQKIEEGGIVVFPKRMRIGVPGDHEYKDCVFSREGCCWLLEELGKEGYFEKTGRNQWKVSEELDLYGGSCYY